MWFGLHFANEGVIYERVDLFFPIWLIINCTKNYKPEQQWFYLEKFHVKNNNSKFLKKILNFLHQKFCSFKKLFLNK